MKPARQTAYGQPGWFEQKFHRGGYQHAAAYYGHSSNGYQQFRYHFLLKLLKPELADKIDLQILDLGCGVGDFLALLKHNFSTQKLLGIDFVAPVISTAQQRFPEMQFICDSLPSLRQVDGKFDLIIASEVLYYLPKEAQQPSLQRLGELLNDDGLVLISSTLAPHTFTPASLAELASDFAIHGQWVQHSRVYLVFWRLLQLPHSIRSAEPSADWPAFRHLVYRLFHLPVIGHVITFLNWLLCLCTTPLLSSRILPACLAGLGQLFGSRLAGSNIIMLLSKKP